jgi:hypothetical protein
MMEKFTYESMVRENFQDYDDVEQDLQDFLIELREQFPTVVIQDYGDLISYTDTLENLAHIVVFETEFWDGDTPFFDEVFEHVSENSIPA